MRCCINKTVSISSDPFCSSKQLEFEGEVKATKDVRLYGKAIE